MFLNSEINHIRHFLDYVLGGVAAELSEIDKKVEEGLIQEFDDLESAQDQPVGRAIIAIRAALYEINALFETYIYRVAYLPWSKIESVRPTSILSVQTPILCNLRKLKLVTDLKFSEVVELIEKYYRISLTDLPGWAEIMEIRSEVNSHKHRAGMIDFRRIPPDDVTTIGSTYPVDSQRAYEGLDAITKFLSGLHDHTRNKPTR